MALLPELLIEIISHIATPANDLAYSLPPANRKALYVLCLTSAACRSIALPHLYRRIYIQMASQIPSLQQGTHIKKHTRTLAVGPLSFEPEIAQLVCGLLATLSSSLERLLISCWGGQTDAERSALAGCSGLQEFILPRESNFWGLYTASDQGLHMTLPRSWVGIRRLSLYRVHLEDFLLAQGHFPQLESLCLSDCWLPTSGQVSPAFTRFVRELSGSRQVFFMVYTEEAGLAKELIRALRAVIGDNEVVFGLRVVNLIEERFKGGIPEIRNTRDALIVFEAVRMGILPLIRRRLNVDEGKEFIQDGAVFVWEEYDFIQGVDGSGGSFQRWTDRMKWSQSKVEGPFLYYEEKVDLPPGAEKVHPSFHAKSRTRPVKPDGMTKQTFSATALFTDPSAPKTKKPRKWHLTTYFRRSTWPTLPTIESDPDLKDITIVDGMFETKGLRPGTHTAFQS
ncbi:hypothetical protein DACRYDRAFT_103576 [Dacryopinax primogenitus]|uniref:Uncharacterized protein n=1 Tax=Dacryopinax primogenitus (strain DJM 731) TaxID=1858805 RepID=M5G8U0_DACPD|nr:uncharacterized protein DACRYDRAFT_103576 [Dacryopinax primogenitus]EJU06626.1 hypothetical protein DACRYDRAFT_103576 [Dacryopinax primogenitus]